MHRDHLRTTVLATWLALTWPALLSAQPPAIGDPHDLTQEITVDRAAYPVGSPVQVTRRTCNGTPDTIQFNRSGSTGPHLEVLDRAGAVVAFAKPDGIDGSIYTVVYDPGECSIYVRLWYQSSGRFDHLGDPLGPQVPEGTYRVRAPSAFPGGDRVVSAAFAIGDAPIEAPALGVFGTLALVAALGLAAIYRLRA